MKSGGPLLICTCLQISELVICISSFERGKYMQQYWKGISVKSNLSPFLMISNMKVYSYDWYHWYIFFSFYSNISVFLPQRFQHLRILHHRGKLRWLLCFLMFTFFFSSTLFSCVVVSSVCLCTPCIDFWGILEISLSFLLLFRKIIKCSFWLKLNFIYSKKGLYKGVEPWCC